MVLQDSNLRIKTKTRNLEVSIRIEMNETDSPLSGNADEVEAISPGQFRLVLDGAKSLDIDAIENGLLRTSYPAIRNALATHLASEVKKMPNQKASYS